MNYEYMFFDHTFSRKESDKDGPSSMSKPPPKLPGFMTKPGSDKKRYETSSNPNRQKSYIFNLITIKSKQVENIVMV